MSVPARCHARMRQVAARVRSDAFLTRIGTPRTRNVEAKSYAAEWYGLSPLAAASVAIRRLIQAEQQLPAMIDAVIAGRASPATPILQPLPACGNAKLRHRSSDRLGRRPERHATSLSHAERGSRAIIMVRRAIRVAPFTSST